MGTAPRLQHALWHSPVLQTSVRAAPVPPGVPTPLTQPFPTPLFPSKQSYERLLRQVVTSRLFRTGGSGSGGGPMQGLRVAQDVQLRLVETEAEATTLLQLQLELDRRPKLGPPAKGGGGGDNGSGAGGTVALAGAEGAAGGSAAAGARPSAAAYLASLDEPPDTLQVNFDLKRSPSGQG